MIKQAFPPSLLDRALPKSRGREGEAGEEDGEEGRSSASKRIRASLNDPPRVAAPEEPFRASASMLAGLPQAARMGIEKAASGDA